MSSVYLKISSLFIRTLSKPIANRLKIQAREHEGFRKICVSFAQSMHRLDMRLRLGLLQDQAAIDRQIAKEAAEAKAKKLKSDSGAGKSDEAGSSSDKEQKKKPPQKIKPLSEAKAIDSGANFISESFLFTVGLALISFETWRSRRKETTRRSDVADKFAELEAKNETLTEQLGTVTSLLAELKEKQAGANSSAGLSASKGDERKPREEKGSSKAGKSSEARNQSPSVQS